MASVGKFTEAACLSEWRFPSAIPASGGIPASFWSVSRCRSMPQECSIGLIWRLQGATPMAGHSRAIRNRLACHVFFPAECSRSQVFCYLPVTEREKSHLALPWIMESNDPTHESIPTLFIPSSLSANLICCRCWCSCCWPQHRPFPDPGRQGQGRRQFAHRHGLHRHGPDFRRSPEHVFRNEGNPATGSL